ncbi:hypothetical protein N0A02_25975 [Paraburkholderia acidicola]|uniref:Integrase catalytic domain-containing protein n=1 Tax=Paraburkholderia acidicola TaxID=1912599 RepID=A0ABV1LUC3_9BURK
MSSLPSGKLIVPEELRDTSKWPCPEECALDDTVRFYRIKTSIQMRLGGATYQAIFQETGIVKPEVIRQIRRCLTESSPGQIIGFFALVRHRRIKLYVRVRPVEPDPLSSSAGAAGALGKLFHDYPSAQKFIDRRFLVNDDNHGYLEAYITFVDLWRQFRKMLTDDLKFSAFDWPFNTGNEGYKALLTYCNALVRKHPERWLRVRKGKKISWKAKTGRGIESLLEGLDPLIEVQLDYLMQDAAGVIHLKDARGLDHPIRVRRWYVGILAETSTSAVLGLYISLEVNPSTDCALETVCSAFESEDHSENRLVMQLLPDGKSLMVSLVPAFRALTWALLHVDNAWCNSSNDFVNNVIDALGCTVVFCTPRAWWQHPVIERVNGQFVKGMHRLRSTYGSSPQDPRRNKPQEKAEEYEIKFEDIEALLVASAYAHNASVGSETNFGKTRVEIANHLLDSANDQYLQQRLPIAKQSPQNLMLLWHCVDLKITGNLNTGKLPHVNIDYCAYTNPELSSDFGLVGETLRIWICRRDIRIAYGMLLRDKRNIGQLKIERRYRRYAITWQVFMTIMRYIHRKPDVGTYADPVLGLYGDLKTRKRQKNDRSGSDSSGGDTEVIKQLEDAGVGSHRPIKSTRKAPPPLQGDPFSLWNGDAGHKSNKCRKSKFDDPFDIFSLTKK